MEFSAKENSVDRAAVIVILLMLGSPAAAQAPKPSDGYLRGIELCNGSDRTSIDTRISGCTALIDSGQGNDDRAGYCL